MDKKSRQIVGFTMTPAMAKAVKTHAAERGTSLRVLFEDMWKAYRKEPVGTKR